MISISVGLLGGLETAAASVGKKGEDGPAFADTFEQAAASGRTKVGVGGTQRTVKIERGTGQAKRAGRSAQSDGGVKQTGLTAATDASGVKSGVVGKKIAGVAEVVEEQVAGDGQDLVARAGGTAIAPQGGKSQVAGAVKGAVGSPAKGGLVESAGLTEETPVALGYGAGALQSGAQRAVVIAKDGGGQTIGSAVIAQKQAPDAFGDGGEKAIGGSIRPDLRGLVDVADAELPVATVQGSGLVAAPAAAGKNGSEPIAKDLTKMVDEGGLQGVEVSSVTSAPEQVAATSSRGEGIALSKTILQTRQIPDRGAAAEGFSGVEQVTGGVKNVGSAVPAGRVMDAAGGAEMALNEPATGQKPVVVVGVAGASPLSGEGSAKNTSAIPVTGVQGSALVEVAVGGKSRLVSPVTAPTGMEGGAESAGEMAGKVDGELHAGPVSTQTLPVAVGKSDVIASVDEQAIVANVPAHETANGLPRVAGAAGRGEVALTDADAEVVAQPLAAHRAGSGVEGSKATVKSAVRHGETERARDKNASESGGGKILVEASAAGVMAAAVGVASVVPAASAPVAAAQVGGSNVAAGEGGLGATASVAAGLGATASVTAGIGATASVTAGVGATSSLVSGSAGNDSAVGVQAGKSTALAGSVTATVEGLKATRNSAGQTLEGPADPVLPTAVATETGQRISRSAGSVPEDANAGAGDVVAGAVAPVRAGQEKKAVSGAAPVGGRERKGAGAESKTADVAGSTGVVDAGRTVTVASSPDAGTASVKPVAAEHRGQGSEGGQVAAVPVAMVDPTGGGAAVPAHVASGMTANVAAAPSVSAAVNSQSSAGAAIGPHAASAAGSAGESLVSPMAHTTLQATPTVLEVGVPGGTHGWLKIRAEIGEGGTVQASMSASNHAGQDALRRDLPAINAFLESEHVPVNVQVVHGTGSSWADKDGAMTQVGVGLGAGLGQGGGQDAQGSARGEAGAGMLADAGSGGGRQQGGNASSQGGVVSETRGRSEMAGRNVVEGEAGWSPAPGYGSGVRANGGSWLNVVA